MAPVLVQVMVPAPALDLPTTDTPITLWIRLSAVATIVQLFDTRAVLIGDVPKFGSSKIPLLCTHPPSFHLKGNPVFRVLLMFPQGLYVARRHWREHDLRCGKIEPVHLVGKSVPLTKFVDHIARFILVAQSLQLFYLERIFQKHVNLYPRTNPQTDCESVCGFSEANLCPLRRAQPSRRRSTLRLRLPRRRRVDARTT